MRIYYPVLARELEEGNLAPRPAYCVDPSSSLRGEDLELAEDDARDLAALDSLALLRDEEGALSRCIIAADIEDISIAPYDGEVAQTQPCAPVQSHIAAYFIDHPDASEKVRAVLDAQTQDEADKAVAQLWDESMEWYAPEEREDVIRILRQMR